MTLYLPAALLVLAAIVSVPLGYGPFIGPRATLAAIAWVVVHELAAWLWRRRHRK